MKYTLLGKSGIEVSRITHGCMELGGGPWDVREDKENIALLNTALEHGITTFDTAALYQGFQGESAQKRRHRRVRGQPAPPEHGIHRSLLHPLAECRDRHR